MTDNTHRSEEFDREKILARIAKLLTLADASRNPNVEEAAAAAEKAQELLHQYNIRLEEAIQRGGNQAVRALVTHRYADQKEGQDKRHMDFWRQFLMAEICRANFCMLILQRGKFILIGHEFNIEGVEQIYHSIANQLEAMCNAKYKQVKRLEYIASGISWKNSFLVSAAQVVATRLRQEASKDMKASATGSALVVRTQQENVEYVNRTWPRLRKNKAKASLSSDSAVRYGRQAGASVEYRKGINPSASKPNQLKG